jgi:hypothetical protein
MKIELPVDYYLYCDGSALVLFTETSVFRPRQIRTETLFLRLSLLTVSTSETVRYKND